MFQALRSKKSDAVPTSINVYDQRYSDSFVEKITNIIYNQSTDHLLTLGQKIQILKNPDVGLALIVSGHLSHPDHGGILLSPLLVHNDHTKAFTAATDVHLKTLSHEACGDLFNGEPAFTRLLVSRFIDSAGTLPPGCRVIVSADIAKRLNDLVCSLFGGTATSSETPSQTYPPMDTDALTGLTDHVGLDAAITKHILMAQRRLQRFAVFCLDLDDFKQVNERFGVSVGDRVLRVVGQRISGIMQVNDVASRVGGDEFVVIQDLRTSPTARSAYESAQALGDRLIREISQPITVDDQEITLSTSIGVASFPDDGTTTDLLLGQARAALYDIKRTGKSGFKICTVRFANKERPTLRTDRASRFRRSH